MGVTELVFRCGYRGGYCEYVNFQDDVVAMLRKSITAKLCPSVSGQVQPFADFCFEYPELQSVPA